MSERTPSIARGRTCATFALASMLLAACNRSPADSAAPNGAPSSPQAQSAPPPARTLPHGDHNPHHGGVVLMKGDLHYEVVFDPDGRAHQLFFSDAVRDDLPASFAQTVSFTVRRHGEPDETIPLEIDGTGESWIGSGRPVADPARTTVRVAFTVENEPYWIDVPFADAKDAKGSKDSK